MISIPVANISPGTMRKSRPPMPKKPDSASGQKAGPQKAFGKFSPVSLTSGVACGRARRAEHHRSDDQHEESEQHQQLLWPSTTLLRLGNRHRRRPCPATANTPAQGQFTVPIRAWEMRGLPPHSRRRRNARRADGDMHARHADEVDHQRHGQHRAPRPRTRPSENPTSTPETTPSTSAAKSVGMLPQDLLSCGRTSALVGILTAVRGRAGERVDLRQQGGSAVPSRKVLYFPERRKGNELQEDLA